ncbi:MAG: AAA family ATPase, partial [Ruminiclostridium sp.]
GKTLAARWLSQTLNRQLLTLDLAAVMSSFLGRTGNNVRAVLNYAMQTSSILLLDEFDAIAKKRDDDTEIGELKRLVTVLLQAVDEWPNNGILIAATNHPELLDPAVWRRFERVINFPFPEEVEIERVIKSLIKPEEQVSNEALSLFAASMLGVSFAEVVRATNELRRESI